ncbi:MAG: thiamine diphosphokinase [Lachnospiraceae bacterium]|nr:thiamine diphosphokinase [Lachnospiraceae bacterium]
MSTASKLLKQNVKADMRPYCFVFGALPVKNFLLKPEPGDLVIAADKGLEQARAVGIEPDLLVGDFDSTGYEPDFPDKVKLNVRKDDTDTAHAMAIGAERGYKEFVIYGAMGGRLEHTIAMIQTASGFEEQGYAVLLVGDTDFAKVLTGGRSFSFPEGYQGRISVFSLSEVSEGVTIRGLSYEMEKGTLTRQFPLGVSNEFTGRECSVSLEKGELLIVYDQQ